MILQVLADVGRIDDGKARRPLRARGAGRCRRASAGEANRRRLRSKSLPCRRTTVRVSPPARYSTPLAVPLIEKDARGLGSGDDGQIRAILGIAFEEGAIGARSLALLGRGLKQRGDARRAAAVAAVVVAARNAGGAGGFDKFRARRARSENAPRRPEVRRCCALQRRWRCSSQEQRPSLLRK